MLWRTSLWERWNRQEIVSKGCNKISCSYHINPIVNMLSMQQRVPHSRHHNSSFMTPCKSKMWAHQATVIILTDFSCLPTPWFPKQGLKTMLKTHFQKKNDYPFSELLCRMRHAQSSRQNGQTEIQRDLGAFPSCLLPAKHTW